MMRNSDTGGVGRRRNIAYKYVQTVVWHQTHLSHHHNHDIFVRVSTYGFIPQRQSESSRLVVQIPPQERERIVTATTYHYPFLYKRATTMIIISLFPVVVQYFTGFVFAILDASSSFEGVSWVADRHHNSSSSSSSSSKSRNNKAVHHPSLSRMMGSQIVTSIIIAAAAAVAARSFTHRLRPRHLLLIQIVTSATATTTTTTWDDGDNGNGKSWGREIGLQERGGEEWYD